MFKGSLSLSDFLFCGIIPRGTNFELEYLLEFKTEFEKKFWVRTRDPYGVDHEENQRPQISTTVLFKLFIGFRFTYTSIHSYKGQKSH